MQKSTQNDLFSQKWDLLLYKSREKTISLFEANNARNDAKWADSSKMKYFSPQTERSK